MPFAVTYRGVPVKPLIIALLVATPIVWLWPTFQYSLLNPQEKLAFLIRQDFDSLKTQKYLPKTWEDIGSIEVNGDKFFKKNWLQNLPLPLNFKPNGNRHLEVEVLPWEVEGKYGSVINYHLLNRDTRETLWEFGRTFELGSMPTLPMKQSKKN